jgi:Na+/H+ antiporter NhaD/arsenite permease-like protein
VAITASKALAIGSPQRAWLVVAMASTLAGNFTLVGSVANLIVTQRARAEGVAISFWAYFLLIAQTADSPSKLVERSRCT